MGKLLRLLGCLFAEAFHSLLWPVLAMALVLRGIDLPAHI
jgi:hypothetical protein